MEARRLWIAFALRVRGRILVDAGAVAGAARRVRRRCSGSA
jgi:glutamate 5-kinase